MQSTVNSGVNSWTCWRPQPPPRFLTTTGVLDHSLVYCGRTAMQWQWHYVAAQKPSAEKMRLKAAVPMRTEVPTMGLHSTKNFVTTNAIQAILSKPPQMPEDFRWCSFCAVCLSLASNRAAGNSYRRNLFLLDTNSSRLLLLQAQIHLWLTGQCSSDNCCMRYWTWTSA